MGTRRRNAGLAARALATGALALAMFALSGGTAAAVASRTSEGVGVETKAPQPSAGPGTVQAPAPAQAPAAAQAPGPTQTPGPAQTFAGGTAAAGEDWIVLALALVAAAGFGRGLWVLRSSLIASHMARRTKGRQERH